MRGWLAFLTGLFVTSLTAAAVAQDSQPCQEKVSIGSLVEPWETFSRTFDNGEVRLAVLKASQPEQGLFHIAILSPPYDARGVRQCATLGLTKRVGFTGISFDDITVTYDAARRMTFQLPVLIFDGEKYLRVRLRFKLDPHSGEIDAEFF